MRPSFIQMLKQLINTVIINNKYFFFAIIEQYLWYANNISTINWFIIKNNNKPMMSINKAFKEKNNIQTFENFVYISGLLLPKIWCDWNARIP